MPALRTTLLGFLAGICALVALSAPAHAAITWSMAVDDDRTSFTSGEWVALVVARSAPVPLAMLSIYADGEVLRSVTLAAGTVSFRALVDLPEVTTTRAVTFRLIDGGFQVAEASVTITAPSPPRVGPNGYARSVAGDASLLPGANRWNPCEVIPVRAKHRRLVASTRKAVRVLRAATGLDLQVVSGSLPSAYGIKVPSATLPGRVGGMGGPRAVSDGRITRGRVRIDLAASKGAVGHVVTHEIAHAVGVDHAPNHHGSLMAPTGKNGTLTAWEVGAFRYAGQGAC